MAAWSHRRACTQGTVFSVSVTIHIQQVSAPPSIGGRAFLITKREAHNESTYFDDNGAALFGGCICHGVTTDWVCPKQSADRDVEDQLREIKIQSGSTAEERY